MKLLRALRKYPTPACVELVVAWSISLYDYYNQPLQPTQVLHMAACAMHLSLLLNKNSFAKDIRIKAKVLSNLKIETEWSDQFRICHTYSLAKGVKVKQGWKRNNVTFIVKTNTSSFSKGRWHFLWPKSELLIHGMLSKV